MSFSPLTKKIQQKRLRSRMRAFRMTLIALFGVGFFTSLCPSAHAENGRRYYIEFAGGTSRFMHGQTFFGTGAEENMGFGTTFQSTLGVHLPHPSSSVKVVLGVQARMASVSLGSQAFGVLGTYAILRFQIADLYFTGGFSPLIWKHSGQAGFDNYNPSSGSMGALLEGGYYYEITPAVGIISAGAFQFISTSGVLSPNPTMEVTIGLRFNFGVSPPPSSDNDSYEGWRYPYGRELRY